MTVTYTSDVATGHRMCGNFIKLLFRWKGSIYKLVLPDLILYVLLYYGINFMYRFWLAELPGDSPHRERFHMIVTYCEGVVNVIPLQFLLAFYISQIVTRWWAEYMTTSWPDTMAVLTAIYLEGDDERGRLMRRTLIRYVNLCILFVFTMVSPQIRKRFPTLDHIVAAGLLMPHEKRIIDNLNEKLNGPKYYVPIVWAAGICSKARKEGRITDDLALYNMMKTLCGCRAGVQDLLSYDWVCVPLVYTQVVTLAVYIYFLAFVIANQQFPSDEDRLDLVVPMFDFLQFFFMMGWLKVAEVMINPFGEDDDDYETNWLVDRNIQVSYLIVDEMNSQYPELCKDLFWDNVLPSKNEMYYTKEALKYRSEGYAGSAAAANEKQEKADQEQKDKEKELAQKKSQANQDDDDTSILSKKPQYDRTHVVRKHSSDDLGGS